MNSDIYTPCLALPDSAEVKLGCCAKSGALAEQLIKAFRPEVDGLTYRSTTLGERSVFAFLMTGQVAMALIEREMTPFESVPYRKLLNSPPFAIKVAVGESASVYVHRSNPLPAISLQQLSQIFTRGNLSGDYSCWSQVDPRSPLASASIQPLRLPDIAPLSVYLHQHHFAQRQTGWNGEYVSHTDALIDALGNMPAGIGMAETGRENQQVRELPVSDGATGRSPLTRYLHLYLPKDENGHLAPPLVEFVKFVLSPSGQQIIATHSPYGPLSAEMATAQTNLMVNG